MSLLRVPHTVSVLPCRLPLAATLPVGAISVPPRYQYRYVLAPAAVLIPLAVGAAISIAWGASGGIDTASGGGGDINSVGGTNTFGSGAHCRYSEYPTRYRYCPQLAACRNLAARCVLGTAAVPVSRRAPWRSRYRGSFRRYSYRGLLLAVPALLIARAVVAAPAALLSY